MNRKYSRERYFKKAAVKALITGVFSTAVFASVQTHAAESGSLFTLQPATSQAELKASATGYLASLFSAPTTQEVRLVTVQPDRVEKSTNEITLPLTDNQTVTFQLTKFEEPKEGMSIWTGEIPTARKNCFPLQTKLLLIL